MMEKQYKCPLVIREVGVETETSFLLGSIVDNVGAVESTGQEVKEYDFSEEQTFNHTWE